MRLIVILILLIVITSCNETKPAQVEYSFKVHEFENLEFDSGDAEKYLIIKNNGKEPYKIDTVISNCGCTVVGYNFKEIKPTKIDSLLVKYNTSYPGHFSRDFVIYSNNNTSPDTFTLKGNVKVK